MEYPMQQAPNLAGAIQGGFQMGQEAKMNNLKALALERENTQKNELQSLYKMAATGNSQAVQQLSMVAPQAYEGLQKYQTYKIQRGGQLANSVLDAPEPVRPELYQKAIETFKSEFGVSPNIPSEYSPEAAAHLKAIVAQARQVEDVAKERQVEYSPQETSSGLMNFNKKTGEYIPAQSGGRNLGVYVKPPTSVVNVNNTTESEYNKTVGKENAIIDTDFYKTISTRGASAQNQQNSLDIIENSLNQIGTTGKLTEASAAISNIANQLGVKVDQNKLANIGTFQSEVAKLVVPQAKDLGPNPSNTDRDFISKMVPQLNDTKEANQLKIQFSRKVNQRNIQLDAAANDMRAKGATPFQIKKALSDYNNANPIFTPQDFEAAKNIGKVKKSAPITSSAIDATAKKYGISREQVIAKLREKGVM